jgi:hypothetical protein
VERGRVGARISSQGVQQRIHISLTGSVFSLIQEGDVSGKDGGREAGTTRSGVLAIAAQEPILAAGGLTL